MYGLDSIRRFQAGGEAFSDDVVRDYIRSLADSSGNIRESDIAAAMSTFGVSPAQVARATGADPGYVSQQYSNYLAEPPPPPPPPPAAVDPVAQKYVNDFNALINQGNYDGAARVVKEAELAGYGDEAYRAAAVALGAKANLPGGSDFIQPEGIASIKSFVEQATRPPPPAPPPAPVDPKVETFNSLIRANNFDEAGKLATSSGFTPEQVLTYLNDPNIFPEFGGNVTLDTVKSFVPQTQAQTDAQTQTDAQAQTDAPTAYNIRDLFLEFLGREPNQQDLINAQDLYGDTLDTPKEIGEFITKSKQEILNRQNLDVNKLFEGDNFPTLDQIRQAKIDGQARVDQEVEDKAAANAEGRPGPGQILGIPSLARQAQSNVPFAPLRRGLAQLRPAAYMPGLTSGQGSFGWVWVYSRVFTNC
jgi:hypothetical protein